MTVIRPAPDEWNAFVCHHARAHILQLSHWGQLKSDYGWQADRIALTDGEKIIAGAQILFRDLPVVPATLAYIPYGALVTDDSQWKDLWAAIHDCARDHRAAWLRWEPGLYPNTTMPDFHQWGFKVSPQTIQPPNTILLAIDRDDDAIMKPMNQSTRRKIRKSLKNDIHYYEAAPDDVSHFTRMMQVTGDRNDFGVHTPDYYQRAYDLLVPDHAVLILAEHDGDHLAGLFVTAAGDTAQYLYGASASKKRKLMASYGVQWQAIQWARQRGCRYYDMWGIPDEDEETLEAQFRDRTDGMWGVYGFKRGFGGQIIRAAGAWDTVYNPLIYQSYQMVLRLRS